MADIKQAAKWMKDGLRVRREIFREHGYFAADDGDDGDGFIHWFTVSNDEGLTDMIDTDDLLADDWEAVE